MHSVACGPQQLFSFLVIESKHINSNTCRNTNVCCFAWLFSSAKAYSPS